MNVKPLTKDDALSRGAFAIDNTTSKSFKIKSAGKRKTIGILRKNERNYFNRAGYKLREYKVKNARGFKIKPRYIEKTRYGIDTRGEKKGLTISKYLKQKRKLIPRRSSIKRTKRKITSKQRKVLLNNLKKGRKVLNKKRKK